MNGLPSVKTLPTKCCLSPNYFGDLVKKETGKTPLEFIQQKIIDIAKEELHSTDVTITEVAYRLGFQSSQHFNRYFKRCTGMTPTEFRKRSRRLGLRATRAIITRIGEWGDCNPGERLLQKPRKTLFFGEKTLTLRDKN